MRSSASAAFARRRSASRAFRTLESAGFALPEIVHASAVISPQAEIGRGAQILALAVVNAAARIGDGAIVNTGAIVEHDCAVGRSAHLGPRAVLGGDVIVGDGAHVGMGAVVVEGTSVGAGAFIAAGAVVVADVPAGARVAGVPARAMAPAGLGGGPGRLGRHVGMARRVDDLAPVAPGLVVDARGPEDHRHGAEQDRRSRRSDWCSTYQTSSSMRSGQRRLLRPRICAQPVIPGLASSRRRWKGVYWSTW